MNEYTKLKEKVIATINDDTNDSISIGNEPLCLTDKCKDIWSDMPEEVSQFFNAYPSVIWNEGSMGGKVCLALEHKNFKKIKKILTGFENSIVIGSDESELFLILPGKHEIWGVDLFLDRAEMLGDIYTVINDFID